LVNSSGAYTERILHTFGVPGDGENPSAPLVMDGGGNFYGTTGGGGVSFGGTAFEVTPAAPAPAVALSASSLDFSQIFNTTSAPQSITVTNTGPANLIFGPSGVALSGTNATEFAISANSCSNATIAPNGTCSVGITFTPKQAATSVATLTFFDNAAVGAQTVSLTGTALGITTTTVGSSSPSIPFGADVTFTAQVTPVISGGPAPTGSVQFTANGSSIGSATLSGGQAQVSTSTLAIGTIPIVASYGGDATYAASSGSFTQYVTNTPWYSVSANPTALIISSPGQSVSTTLTFTSHNGLYGSGALSSSNCGIPASEEITCSLAPFTLPANGTTTALLTFTSTAAYTSASVRIDPRSGQPITHGQMLGALASACFLCLAPLGFTFRRKGGWRFALTALLFAITVTCASCGGSGGSGAGGGGGSGNPGTPTGPVQGLNVSILIDGTAQTVPNLTLTVQ
ncbi:MAG: Ig-like domain repeat protein, partial [Acidobacteriota bacterium]|nr:Ig-like domain repeat protein [Acidobacteriota bacterium]